MEVDTYDVYNIEYSNNILDTYYKILDYCDQIDYKLIKISDMGHQKRVDSS